MPTILVLVLIFIILLILVSCIRIVPQAQAMVVERLGAYLETWMWESTSKFRLLTALQSGSS